MFNLLKNQKGEIATTLTLISLGLMTLGTLLGTWAVRKGPLKILTKAAFSWWMEVFSISSYPSLEQHEVKFSVSRDRLSSGGEEVTFFIRHDGENAKYFTGSASNETGFSTSFAGPSVVNTKVSIWLNWSQTYINEGCPALSGLAYGYSSNRLGKHTLADNFSLPGLGAQCPSGPVQPTTTPSPTPTSTPAPTEEPTTPPTEPTATPEPTATSTPVPTAPEPTETPTPSAWERPVNYSVFNFLTQEATVVKFEYSIKEKASGNIVTSGSFIPTGNKTVPAKTTDVPVLKTFTETLNLDELGLDRTKIYLFNSLLRYELAGSPATLEAEEAYEFLFENAMINQIFKLETSLPDLTCSEITLEPTAPKIGQKVKFGFTESNIGNANSLSHQAHVMMDDVQIYRYTLPGRAAGTSYTFTPYVPPLGWEATAGNHTLKVLLDPEGQITEKREDNNECSKLFNVPGAAPTATLTPPTNWCTCEAADINDDNVVNDADQQILNECFGETEPLGDCADADLNGDGVVNAPDLSCLASHFNETCGGLKATPTPDTRPLCPTGSDSYYWCSNLRVTCEEYGTREDEYRCEDPNKYCCLTYPTSTPPSCPTILPTPANVQIVFTDKTVCANATPPPGGVIPTVSGDLNSDSVVNTLDLMLFMNSVGVEEGQKGYNQAADINNDGVTNALDGSLMLKLIGT